MILKMIKKNVMDIYKIKNIRNMYFYRNYAFKKI